MTVWEPTLWQSLAAGYGLFAAPLAAYFYVTARRLNRTRRNRDT